MNRTVAFAAPFLLLTGCAIFDTTGSRVSRLVDETTVAETKDDAFEKLEAMDEVGVPYIIGHLEDGRLLPQNTDLTLRNKWKGAFEGLRHYRPDTVHQGLIDILNQITGESFPAAHFTADEAGRQAAAAPWRAWCAKKYPDKVKICNGST